MGVHASKCFCVHLDNCRCICTCPCPLGLTTIVFISLFLSISIDQLHCVSRANKIEQHIICQHGIRALYTNTIYFMCLFPHNKQAQFPHWKWMNECMGSDRVLAFNCLTSKITTVKHTQRVRVHLLVFFCRVTQFPYRNFVYRRNIFVYFFFVSSSLNVNFNLFTSRTKMN